MLMINLITRTKEKSKMRGECSFEELCITLILILCALLYGVYITLNYMTINGAEDVLAKSYNIK